MTMRIVGLGMATVLLGGCATTAYQPRYSYYQVPCNTPGAVIATPVAGPGGVAVAPAYPAPGAAVVLPGTPSVASCIVAVSDQSYGYRSSYYDGYGGYGRPYYGSFGMGFGFSSYGHGHHSVGHHSRH